MVKDVISMLDVYFSKVQQVLLVVAAVAVIAGIVILFRKSPKFEGKSMSCGRWLFVLLCG